MSVKEPTYKFCPFCGAKPKVKNYGHPNWGDYGVKLTCSKHPEEHVVYISEDDEPEEDEE